MPEFLTPAVGIFLLTYLGVALGEIPGLAIDRTGIALLGGVAMIAFGVLNTEEAVGAVDMPTILLLFGLMVLSSQFRLGGFYTHVALQLTRFMDRPALFLWGLMVVSALLSAVLANDIVCLAFTPVLCWSLSRRGLNPLPYLLGLAISSNIGSAATIIGNPQNMLIGQVANLSFLHFTLWCSIPSVFALAAAFAILVGLFRGAWMAKGPAIPKGDWPDYDRRQSAKGLVVTALLIASFFTSVPRELSALVAAGVLLCSRRMATRSIMGLVDWHLITLFIGLFVVVRGFENTGWPAYIVETLRAHGIHLDAPMVLAGLSAVLSNLVSNVPAVMLLTKFIPTSPPEPWYVLALASTFAGNLITIGSIANLIVIEQAKQSGIEISFADHARAGIPVTLASFAILYAWIALAA
ncbi:MAG: anion transporter [Kiritimatiellae bacterium]|nr:anion transporter [Kiritimatiellia bacterium]MDW8458501.1 anion transporter [Verrucomicrobiota bacterium]